MEIKDTENAWKLRRIAKEKGEKSDTAWKSKPLHDQHSLRSQKVDVDIHDTHQYLRSAGLKAETERFIVAAQDQSHFTRNVQANILPNTIRHILPRCRYCNTSTETIYRFILGCTILARNEYKNRHSRVGQYTHWKICNHYEIETPSKWYEHKPLPFVDTKKNLWEFSFELREQ